MKALKVNYPQNHKIVIVNLAKIDPGKCYPAQLSRKELRQMELCFSFDGKVYINSKSQLCELLANVFALLIPEQISDLEAFIQKYKEKFAELKSIADVSKVESDMRYCAIVYFMIPAEMKRREIEKNYYKS